MASVSTNIKIDTTLKQQAQELFNGMGINLSTAVNLFLAQAVREQAIPFRIGEPLPNLVTLAAMDAAEHDKDVYGPFDSVSALMEALDA